MNVNPFVEIFNIPHIIEIALFYLIMCYIIVVFTFSIL